MEGTAKSDKGLPIFVNGQHTDGTGKYNKQAWVATAIQMTMHTFCLELEGKRIKTVPTYRLSYDTVLIGCIWSPDFMNG